jgi:hypothetical protein
LHGTVEISAAAHPHESGPITLWSNIDLKIDSGAQLQALPFSQCPGTGSASSIANFILAENASKPAKDIAQSAKDRRYT